MKPPKTRAGAQWTEAKFWGFLRSALRRSSLRWPGRTQAMYAARRPYSGASKMQKWEYQCKACNGWFKGSETHLDHLQPCGSLLGFSDLPGFVDRLFCEKDGYQVLCKRCHNQKTHNTP